MICSFCLSVAARSLARADPPLKPSSMLLGRHTTNTQYPQLCPDAVANWNVVLRLSACPQSLLWRGVSVVQASRGLSSRRGLVCTMWAGDLFLRATFAWRCISQPYLTSPLCSVLWRNVEVCCRVHNGVRSTITMTTATTSFTLTYCPPPLVPTALPVITWSLSNMVKRWGALLGDFG